MGDEMKITIETDESVIEIVWLMRAAHRKSR